MSKRMRVAILIAICLSLTATAIAQDGRIVRETVYSPSLEGNLLGDSPNRQVTIYLPPSYDDGLDMAYPVVYLLHGYTGNNELWMGGSYIGAANLVSSMSSWLKSGKVKEMILVMPNSRNKLNGSWYTNSAATGNWADYIVRDLVSYIDSNYRTLPQQESRAVIGHSMGGYGAMKLGMLYSELFSCMGGMAGAYVTSITHVDQNSQGYALVSLTKDWQGFNSLQWFNQADIALAAAIAPNINRPPFYCDLPFVYTDDNPRKIVKVEEVYNKYAEDDTVRLAEKHVWALTQMRAIYIDCGTNDDLIGHSRRLHEGLDKLGIKHFYREFSCSHTCCVMTSTGDALEVFSNAMAFEMLVSVEAAGKLAAAWGQIRKLE